MSALELISNKERVGVGTRMKQTHGDKDCNVLELRDVSFSYGKTTLFSRFSFTFTSDERVALQARSGRGKTTLCRLLAGYLHPQEGGVFLNGEALPEFSPSRPCPVQMIWQHPEHTLDPLIRIQDSLEEAGSLDEELLSQLGIRHEWLSRFPRELSGGELQRCCIARAVRVHPQFLIADELSTMLDAITQAHIWEFLLSYCERECVGLVLVTHSKALQDRLATRVLDLE